MNTPEIIPPAAGQVAEIQAALLAMANYVSATTDIGYTSVSCEVTRHESPESKPEISWRFYANNLGWHNSADHGTALAEIIAAGGPIARAKKMREDAALLIAKAAALETATPANA